MIYPGIHLLNFRDVGGMKTKDGRSIKNGYLFRSAYIPTDIDKETISNVEALGLNTIFDLRDPFTLSGRTDYPFSNIKNVSLSLLESIDSKFKEDKLDFTAIDVGLWDYSNPTFREFKSKYQEYLKLYKQIPFSKEFTKIFEALDHHEKILVHCQGGKDRTGILFFVLLNALGVNEKDIVKDYLASNFSRKKKNKRRIQESFKKSHKLYCAYYMKKLVVVEKKYYELSIKAIIEEYGSFENYLKKHFNVTKDRIENWKNFYLER